MHHPSEIAIEGPQPGRILTRKEILDIAEKIISFACDATGISLYPYQREFSLRIIQSLLLSDGEEITALFSRQSGKCLGIDTPVLMHDGTIKFVQNIQVGDILMGDDSTPRNVLSICRGSEQLYRVCPRNGYHESYVVNASHIMTVWNRRKKQLVDKSLCSLLKLKEGQESYSGAKVSIDFPPKLLPVDPYWLGLWLGDGASRGVQITTADAEIAAYLAVYAQRLGMQLSVYHENSAAESYAITNGKKGTRANLNPLLEGLRALGLPRNKHIPLAVRANDRATRLLVLAGLIDSDGHRPKGSGKENGCTFCFASEKLTNGIQWLARSLGFRAGKSPKIINGVTYWRLRLYGALWEIPTKLPRKKWKHEPLRENPLTYGFDLVSEGVGDYYGFEIDGNQRFLLGDCTVTHNTEAVAIAVVGAMVMLPLLAKIPRLKDDERIAKFKDGLRVGIFAPTFRQSGIMYQRIASRLKSQRMRDVLREPDINLEIPDGRKLILPNGSLVDCNSAAPMSSIEGGTYELIICEECQGISNYKIRKSIHPMLAATNGTIIKIGTPNMQKGDFFEACERNRSHDLDITDRRATLCRHFQYDYETAGRYNKDYARYVEKEIERNGYDSDEFRMAYRLHWLIERTTYVTPEIFEECAVREREIKRAVLSRGQRTKFVRPAYITPTDRHTENQVASLDIGRTDDSTVLTCARVWWENPQDHAGQTRYFTHINNWLEIAGDDHEIQYPQILHFLNLYNISTLVVDATGRGDPIFSRLYYELEHKGITVVPFIFTQKSKHLGYTLLNQEISEHRLTYPSGPKVKRLVKWRRFMQQMLNLEKHWAGKYMQVEAPKQNRRVGRRGGRRTSEHHDDYPDSLMMLSWIIHNPAITAAESFNNPFMNSRDAALNHMLRQNKARERAGRRNGRTRARFAKW